MAKKKRKQKIKSVKHDAGKPRLSLLSAISLFQTAEVMTHGEKVYGTHNWRSSGFKWTRIGDSALRHLNMWLAGMDNDPDTGLSNLAHLQCCIMFLQEQSLTKKHLDDRYKLPKKVLEQLYPAKKKAKRKK